jgi:hypothetical protein
VVAADAGHRGQADARVAAGGLDDAAGFGDLAFGLQILEHGPRGAVLDRAEWVHPLELGEKVEAGDGGEGVDADQRRGVVHSREHLENVVVDAGRGVHAGS